MITYFIQSGDFVKIGRTTNLQKRIDQLRVGFPQDPIILNVCEMPEKVAHEIAGKISKQANGEWFELNERLLEWISAIETIADERATFVLKSKKRKPLTLPPPAKVIKSKGVKSEGIKAMRKSLGVSVQEFASRLGVSTATVYGWQAGRLPSTLAMRAMSKLIKSTEDRSAPN